MCVNCLLLCYYLSQDGSLLVTLVPSNLPMTTVVGLYSLNRANLGDCYATYRYHTLVPVLVTSLTPVSSLESSAVSVSLSPTSRHLLVGLTSRTSRIISLSPMDRQLMAQVSGSTTEQDLVMISLCSGVPHQASWQL